MPSAFEIVDGGAERDDVGDVRRAGLELVGQVGVRARLVGHALDHLTAAEERVHGLEKVALAVEDADAGRAEHLVRRRTRGSRSQGPARRPACAARTARHRRAQPRRRDAPLAAMLLDRVDRAEDVRHLRDGDDLRAFADLRQRRRPRPAAPSRRCRCSGRFAPVASAMSCHGTRLLWCSIAEKTISSPGLRNLRPQAFATRLIDSVVLRVKMISCSGCACVDEAAGLHARGLVGGRRLFGERVQAAVDVGVVVLVVVHERVDHLARLLRGRGVVEVHERLAVHLPVEDGEVFADGRLCRTSSVCFWRRQAPRLQSGPLLMLYSSRRRRRPRRDRSGPVALPGAHGAAVRHVELRAVAGTLDEVAFQLALVERAAIVRADVIDGVEAAVDVAERDALAVDLDAPSIVPGGVAKTWRRLDQGSACVLPSLLTSGVLAPRAPHRT